MKKMFGLVVLLALSSLPALAQDTPKLEVGGGYAYRMWNTDAVDSPSVRFNMNGWDANANYNVTNKVGLALDVTATRTGAEDATQWVYSFLAGPRFYPLGHHKLTPFVHAMAGAGMYKLNLSEAQGGPFSYSQTRLVYGFGGGIDASVTSRIAIRVGEVDYERSAFTIEQDLPVQNNFRFSAGVVIHLGSK
jgi:opacity protein-like surface antigen